MSAEPEQKTVNEGFPFSDAEGGDSPYDRAAVLVIRARSGHLEVERASFNRHLHGDEGCLELPHLHEDSAIISP